MNGTDFLYQAKRILAAIDSADSVLVVTHQKPDGDALGSATAMLSFLDKLEKEGTAFCLDTPGDHFNFLPHLHRISTDMSSCDPSRFDLLIILDCSDLTFAGMEHLTGANEAPLPQMINIDHHISNTRFGDYHLIDPHAPSTTALIYHLIALEHRHLIDHRIATALLTGLVTDTGHFSNPATSPAALSVGAELLRLGASYRTIATVTRQTREVQALKLWGKALTRLRIVPPYRLALTFLTFDDLRALDADAGEAVEGIANFLSTLKEADVILLLKEEESGVIRGSLRTISDHVDVSKLARFLGGGGHRKAAGFSVKGKLVETPEGWRVIP